jgi:hypothetical protein
VEFKLHLEEKNSTKFYATNILAFQVNEAKKYISYHGKVSTNRVDLAHLSAKVDTSNILTSIFIKQITIGKNLKLYYHQDNLKTRYFVADLQDGLVELRYFRRMDENKEVITNNFFKGQLLLYANKYKPNNEEIVKKINNANYYQSDIEQIVDQLNDKSISIKGESDSTNSKSGLNINNENYRLFIGGGIDNTNTNFTVTNTSYNGFMPRINTGIDIYNNKRIQKFILRLELSFFYVTPKFDHFTFFGQILNGNPNSTFAFNQFNFSASSKFLYTFYQEVNRKIYIGAGLGFNYSIYSNSKLLYYDSSGIYRYSDNPLELENLYLSIPIEIGMVFNNKFELSFMYIPNANYSSYTSFKATNQVNSLCIKYFLN